MTFEQGYALLIGVGTNQGDSNWDAPITVRDAQAVAQVLCDARYCGYPETQMKLLTDGEATRTGILRELDWLAKTTHENSTVLIFFSGHGLFDKQDNYYLVSHDTKIVSRQVADQSGVSQAALLEKLKAIKAGRVLMIFNACHSGEITLATLGDYGKPVSDMLPNLTANALLATGRGRIVITACREKQRSYYRPADTQTLFTQVLIESLQGNEIAPHKGVISAFDLYATLYERVRERVKQLCQAEQEPEFTALKLVSSFPVALFAGGANPNLGTAPERAELPQNAAARTVEQRIAEQAYQQIITHYTQTVTQSGGVNFGQNNQVQVNGPVVGGNQIDTGGGAYIGGNVHVGRDFVGRDKIVYGDEVHGDKVGGDKITVGNITGSSNIAIGKNITAIYGAGGNDLGRVFEPVEDAVRSNLSSGEQADAIKMVKRVQLEAEKGANADDEVLADLVSSLVDLAPAAGSALARAFASPQAAVAVGQVTKFVLKRLAK